MVRFGQRLQSELIRPGFHSVVAPKTFECNFQFIRMNHSFDIC